MENVLLIVLLSSFKVHNVFGLWDEEVVCPKSCTCRLEHATEMAIYRFMQQGKEPQRKLNVMDDIINNEVYYEDPFDKDFFADKDIVKSATCVLVTDVQPLELINHLPENIESLTLIQGSESGNKTFKFSYLEKFKTLISLELIGSKSGHFGNNSTFICEIDVSPPEMKYLNLEKVHLKNSKQQVQKFLNEVDEDTVTFEYLDKHDTNLHPLTFLRKDVKEVLPYKKYLQRGKHDGSPLFIGFADLILLRISSCELNNVHWEMFDGLENLKFLILEKNNLRFIPDFTFYGTPHLKSLSLAWNNLLNIQITDLAGLLELEYLDLSHNNFSQLSELSLPPFPNLKLANFGNNPITVIYPNTFEVMNTTESLIVGADDTSLTLMPKSFVGLSTLKSLTVHQLSIPLLQRELLTGMPNLEKLTLIGNITEIEFDAFLELPNLQTLILTGCNIRNVSMDSFIGLQKLTYLDLSKNMLNTLPPGVFDQLTHLKELYLNNNNLTQLPRDVFTTLHLKLLRLNENPWHCSCEMSEWKPMVVNKVKQRSIKPCDTTYDKGLSCTEDHMTYKYVYDIKVAPKCITPEEYINWNVFHVMRKQFKCPDFRPKIRKVKKTGFTSQHTTETTAAPQIEETYNKIDPLNWNYTVGQKNVMEDSYENTNMFNELNPIGNQVFEMPNYKMPSEPKMEKFKKYNKIHKLKKM